MAPASQVASTTPNAPSNGFLSNFARKVGFGGAAANTSTAAQPIPAKPKVIEAKRGEPAPRPESPKAAKPETRQAAVHPPLKSTASDPPPAAAPANDGMVAGAQPIVQANSFENRFSAAK